MNTKELFDATNSLQNWFKSQELPPAHAVMIAEMFIARMISANGTSSVNIEEKFELIGRTIQEYTTFCLLVHR